MEGTETGWFGAKNLPAAIRDDEPALRSYLTQYARAEGWTVADDAPLDVVMVEDTLDPGVKMAVGRIKVTR